MDLSFVWVSNIMSEHIYPIFETILSKEDKEKLLKQKGIVIWLIGLSGSGKSTLARALENQLHKEGYFTQLLDGDNLRVGLNKNLGFSDEDRRENLRRTAETAKLFANSGVITICSFITPTESARTDIRDILGELYLEVFIDCPLEECEKRDVKGIYAKARKGEISNFTGISAPFDRPENPFITLHTDQENLESSLKRLRKSIEDRISL